jgi:hypothetical protein
MVNLNPFTFFGAKKTASAFKEAGVSGNYIYSGWLQDRERNPKLSYLQRSTEYENLIANIAIVGAGIRYMTDLCASAEWSVKPSEADKNEEYSQIIERMMSETETPWTKIVRQAIPYRYLGFSLQEWTAHKLDDGLILPYKIEVRPQRTIEQFDQNAVGEIIGFGQKKPGSGELLYIPRNKTLYIIDDVLTDSPVGMGVLRHVFESCERLKNYLEIEYASYARDLRGIPIGRAPYTELAKAVKNGELTEAQAKAATSAMESLMQSSKKLPDTAIILDSAQYTSVSDTGKNISSSPQWGIDILQGNGNGFADLNKAIERIQTEIARVLSSENLMLSGGGSQALSKDKSANTYLTANSILYDIHTRATKDLIGRVWELNGFPPEMMPTFSVEEISARDAESVANVLKTLAGAGATLATDDPVINEIRQSLGVSEADLAKAERQLMGAE